MNGTDKLWERFQDWEDGLSARNRALWDTLLFLLTFTVLALPLYLLLWNNWNPIWLRSANAAVTGTVLNWLGITAQHIGTGIHAPGLFVDVSTDSTAWKSVLALTALIVSVRGPSWRKKLQGIGIGIIFLAVANITRLVSMIVAVVQWGVSYEFIHTFLWRWGLTGCVLLYWLAWLYHSGGEQDT